MVFGVQDGLRDATTAGDGCPGPAGALRNVSGRLGPRRTLQTAQGPLRSSESDQIWPVQQKNPTITESTVPGEGGGLDPAELYADSRL